MTRRKAKGADQKKAPSFLGLTNEWLDTSNQTKLTIWTLHKRYDMLPDVTQRHAFLSYKSTTPFLSLPFLSVSLFCPRPCIVTTYISFISGNSLTVLCVQRRDRCTGTQRGTQPVLIYNCWRSCAERPASYLAVQVMQY